MTNITRVALQNDMLTITPGNPAQRLNINLSPEERTMNATEVAQNNFNSWNPA
jgi:hypothetical protein